MILTGRFDDETRGGTPLAQALIRSSGFVRQGSFVLITRVTVLCLALLRPVMPHGGSCVCGIGSGLLLASAPAVGAELDAVVSMAGGRNEGRGRPDHAALSARHGRRPRQSGRLTRAGAGTDPVGRNARVNRRPHWTRGFRPQSRSLCSSTASGSRNSEPRRLNPVNQPQNGAHGA